MDWSELTKMTGGARIVVERVKLADSGVSIDGAFDLAPLAQLTAEDQVFVAAFVRCHGSIKQMEKFFGVSYPTIKNRLNRISAQLPFAEVDVPETPPSNDVLSRLEHGEITAADAIAELRGQHDEQH